MLGCHFLIWGSTQYKAKYVKELKNGTEPIQDGFWISEKLLKESAI